MSDQFFNLQQFAKNQLGMNSEQTKPTVLLPGNGVQFLDTAENLYKLAAAAKSLYYKDGSVMRLSGVRPNALPTLIPLTATRAISEFEKYARFGRMNGDKVTGSVLNECQVKVLLECELAKDLLPNVNATMSRPVPVLRNGQIQILQPGYNENTGYWVAGGGQINEPGTVEEAVEIIETIFSDFSFQTESDYSRAIACFLTPALKLGGFISDLVPTSIIEANESQTGKGYFLHLRSLVYGETSRLVAPQRGGAGSFDESFGSALLSGQLFIQLDNIRGNLDSQFIESFITNPASFSVRIPFAAARTIDGALRFISITSNGMTTKEDLVNRSIIIRLIKEPGRELTTVRGKTIEQLIREGPGIFMGAITKVIRYYHELGMPRTAEDGHARTEWVQKMDWIVQNIFHLPPLMEGHLGAQERMQNPALGFIRELAIRVEQSGRLGHHLRAAELADVCFTNNLNIPGHNETEADDREKAARKIGSLMKAGFDGSDLLRIDQFTITRERAPRYNLSNNPVSTLRYTFTRDGVVTAGAQDTDDMEGIQDADDLDEMQVIQESDEIQEIEQTNDTNETA